MTLLLLRTPAPHATESLLGYALRVSETNGYDSPWHVFSLANFHQGKMKSTGFDTNKLATVLGCTPESLEPLSYISSDEKPNFKLYGHSLGRSLKLNPLRLNSPSICPQCIEETGHLDCFWDLSIATVCPTHGTRAIRTCPSCHSRLTWFRPGLLTCKCGASLSIKGDHQVPTAELELMRLIYAKLHREEQPLLPHSTLPISQLWNLPLRSLIDLLLSTGAHALGLDPAANRHSRTAAIAAAVDVFSNWPANFHEFLRKFDKQEGNSSISIRKRFERFYLSMFKQRNNSSEFSFMKKEMIRFGSSAWGDGLVDARMLSGDDSDVRYVSREKLAKLIGVDPRTVSDWAAKGKLKLKKITLRNNKRFVADTDGFHTPTSSSDVPILHLREAAKRIGLPVVALRHLKHTKHYAPRHMPPFKRGFHPADLDDFVQQLLNKSEALAAAPSLQTMSLGYVMQEIRFWSDSGKGEFIGAILDGKINSLGRLDDQLSSILFLRSDVLSFARQARVEASAGTISLREAAKIIGYDASVVADLVRSNHLVGQPGPFRLRIDRESLDRFTSAFVSMQSIALELSSTTTKLAQLCANSGIAITKIPRGKPGFSLFIEVDQKINLVEAFHKDRPSIRISAVTALSNYLSDLRQNDQLLPRRANQPNLVAIAKACKFERSGFYKNVDLQELLSSYQQEEIRREGIALRRSPIDALTTFLAQLQESGNPLPMRGNRPNIRQIAKHCGFKRDWFYVSPELRETLAQFNLSEEPIN